MISGTVDKLPVESFGLKVPHIGWNDVKTVKESPLFTGIEQGSEFYFVHSYEFRCADQSDIVATADYGVTFTAAIQRENIVATQFHPEKSQDAGLQFLENFIHWSP